MKIKAILAALIGAVAIQGATAGTSWAPPAKAKCVIDDCPDIGGNISVGYDTDYVFKGVRQARDVVWGDVNYTFENLPFSPNVGVWHLTDLNNAGTLFGPTSNYGDETNLYASINLPSILGFDSNLGYTHFLFPTQRGPSPGGPWGDGYGQLTLSLARELIWGIVGSYSADYGFGGRVDSGWMHTLALEKGFDITDAIGLDLSGGVLYNDNYWSYPNAGFPGPGNVLNTFAGGTNARDAGWHSYFLRAGLPIALNCRATLTPYIQYNGTPDTWTGDGMVAWPARLGVNANRNDALYGGVSLNVNF